MGNQTEYFERTGYKPEYHIGDRVFGHYNGIPFAGTVGNDTLDQSCRRAQDQHPLVLAY
jgi:hypothetical protein